MAKTYTIHYSKKYAAAGSSTTSAALYGQANPENYPAGIYQNKTRAVVCMFSGLKAIDQANVTEIQLHLQRLVGGSHITYSVDLTHSVLAESLEIDGESFTLRRGYPIFTTNDKQWQWEASATDVGGEYRTITIPASLFSQLRDFGWAITYRSSSYLRSIFVGDVYLTVSTKESDYTLSYNANGGSGAPPSQSGTGVGGYNFLLSTTVPKRTGYTFLGWSTSKTATSAQYHPGDTVRITSNTTLYAVWKAIQVFVNFDATGGQVSPSSKMVTYNQAYGDLPTPIRMGYRFDGWFTAATGGSKIASTTIVTALSNHTVYAHWTVQSVVHVYKNGLYTGTVHVKGKDNTMHLGIVYCKGSDNKLHINA